MAVGWSAYTANAMLNALGNATAFSVTTVYVQLHTADPGAAGTTAVAGNATRKAASFAAATGGTMTTDAAVSWTAAEVTTAEDYTHISLWDAATLGNFLASGTITANAVAAGDTFTLAAGDIDLSVPLAA